MLYLQARELEIALTALTGKSMEEQIVYRLEGLKQLHSNLDEEIDLLCGHHVIDQLKIQRLKREKLRLKDEIIKLESLLHPDLTA